MGEVGGGGQWEVGGLQFGGVASWVVLTYMLLRTVKLILKSLKLILVCVHVASLTIILLHLVRCNGHVDSLFNRSYTIIHYHIL